MWLWKLLGWTRYRCGCWRHVRRPFHCSHPWHYHTHGPEVAAQIEAHGLVDFDVRPRSVRRAIEILDEPEKLGA